MANLRFIQAGSFSISASGASSGDTTLTVQSFKQIDGLTNIVTADLGDLCYGTLEPNNGTQEEAISFTGVTQNTNGTATLTGVKTVGFNYPYTTSSGLAKSHAGGVTFILSNDAGFYGNIKSYIDTVALQGAPMATNITPGITFLSVAAANAASAIAIGSNNTYSGTPTSSTNKVIDSLSISTTATANAIVQANSSGKIDPSFITSISKFGGTGVNGLLSVTSGTTQLNLNSLSYVEFNYSSISITGTGSISFINPATNGTLVVFKSTGNVTVTSSATPAIDLRGVGSVLYNNGIAWMGIVGAGVNSYTASGANGGTVPVPVFTTANPIYRFVPWYVGAAGGLGQGSGGTGGTGGGALILECAGALNFTGILNASGSNGTNGTGQYGSGGGGGGGGSAFLLYNTVTATSGTFTVTGGTGGTGTLGGGSYAGGAGGGASGTTAGSSGTSAGGGNNGTGGTGANGYYIISANMLYV